MSLHCYFIENECGLQGFLDLDPVLVGICNMFIFKLGKPSLGKGFSLSLEHPIEKNHALHFIGKLICMKGRVIDFLCDDNSLLSSGVPVEV